MAGSGFRVKVYGLDELGEALDWVGDHLEDELRRTGNTIAEEEAKSARAAAQTIGGVAAHSAGAVYADTGGSAPGVGLDGAGYPTAWGAEHGAIQYPQFPAYVGPDDGYFLYPTVADDEDSIVDAYVDSFDRLLKKAGLA